LLIQFYNKVISLSFVWSVIAMKRCMQKASFWTAYFNALNFVVVLE